MLEFNTEEYHWMEDSEFDAIVNEHLGFKDYSIAAYLESGNGSLYCYDKVQWPPKYASDLADIELAIEGKPELMEADRVYFQGPFVLLSALVAKEIIPPGNYLISVSW